MPDFSLKLPNLTADISWSLRIRDSIAEEVAAIDGGGCGSGGAEEKGRNGGGRKRE